MKERKKDKCTVRYIWLLFAIFSIVMFAAGTIVFFFQTVFSIIVALAVFALCMWWLSGKVCNAIEKERYESGVARYIISSQSEHYQKMNEMYNAFRILRHDYKYHLNAISELAVKGNIAEIKEYLSNLQTKLPKNTLQSYCKNSVINALLESYAERCANKNIECDIKLDMPEALSITNYDMCIILGNLLENAIDACQKLKEGGGKIELEVKPHGVHLAIMVKNSFSGEIVEAGGQLASTKKNYGFGLQSIRAVADRYDGNVLTEWDNTTFKAYVMVKCLVVP